MRIRVCDWSIANAMVDRWGDSEYVHCRKCVIRSYEDEMKEVYGADYPWESFLDSCHRGGFVPAMVDGFICEVCEVQH